MRITRGEIDAAKDILALRRFARLTQEEFAEALGISVHTLRNWEQGRRRPEGPAIALLRIAARRPSVLRENLAGRRDPRIFVGSGAVFRWFSLRASCARLCPPFMPTPFSLPVFPKEPSAEVQGAHY